MGILIPMPRPKRKDREPPPPGGADLLFFTGVRYERHDDKPVASPGAEGRPRTRRRRRA